MSLECKKTFQRPELRPGPRWGSLQAGCPLPKNPTVALGLVVLTLDPQFSFDILTLQSPERQEQWLCSTLTLPPQKTFMNSTRKIRQFLKHLVYHNSKCFPENNCVPRVQRRMQKRFTLTRCASHCCIKPSYVMVS